MKGLTPRERVEILFQLLKSNIFKGDGKNLTPKAILKAKEILEKPKSDKIIISPYIDKN